MDNIVQSLEKRKEFMEAFLTEFRKSVYYTISVVIVKLIVSRLSANCESVKSCVQKYG